MRLDTQKFRDCSEGIIQKVDNAIAPANGIYLGLNVLFDTYLGRATLRAGTDQLGAQIVDGKSCLGLWEHITTAGTVVPLAVFNVANDATSTLSKYTTGVWSDAKTGLTAGAKMRFATFLDTTVGVNGTDKISSADGSSWVTTGGNLDVGNMPAGNCVVEFLDRIHTAGVSASPDTLYRSSTPDAGAISWTSGNDTIDIELEEGAGPIRGLAKVPGYVLIFKERSLKRWDGQSTYPESMMTIGALSQEAIVTARQSVMFYNPKRGIFETTGGMPRRISRRVEDIIDAVPSSYYTSISGGSDAERVYFSIGDITLGDLALTNCVLVMSLDTQNWSLLSFPNEIKRFHRRVDSYSDEILMGGDDDGNVWDLLEGIGDGASEAPFDYLFQLNEIEFGSRGRLKEISKVVAYTEGLKNGTLFCKTNGIKNFEPVGKIDKAVEEIVHDLKGRYFELRLQGRAKEGQIIGFDFPSVTVNESYND